LLYHYYNIMGFSGLPPSPTAGYTAAPSTPTNGHSRSKTEHSNNDSMISEMRNTPIRTMLVAIGFLAMIVLVRTGVYTSETLDVDESRVSTTRIRTQSHKTHGDQSNSWMDRIVARRTELADVSHRFKTTAHDRKGKGNIKNKRRNNDTMIDLSILYKAVSDTVRDVGVRGLLFEVLSDDFEYYVYSDASVSGDYDDDYSEIDSYWENCYSQHGVGERCNEWDVWWTYHYIGAIVTDMLLEDHELLWDGSTGETISNTTIATELGNSKEMDKETDDIMAELLDRIHSLQQSLPYVTQSSFHAQHALIWRYVENFPKRLAESYPWDLALKFCRGDGSRPKGIVGRPVNKGIDHECFHGFGHAMFYAVASRQLQREGKQHTEKSMKKIDEEEFLVLRPHSGFELSRDSYCEVYDLCKGASPPSKQRKAMDPNDEASSNSYRTCFEGVVHSVRLLSDDFKHMEDKDTAIKTVKKQMKRCARERRHE